MVIALGKAQHKCFCINSYSKWDTSCLSTLFSESLILMNAHVAVKWRQYLMLSSEWSSPFCWLHHFLITNTIGIDFRPLGCTCGLASQSVCGHLMVLTHHRRSKSIVQRRLTTLPLNLLWSGPLCSQAWDSAIKTWSRGAMLSFPSYKCYIFFWEYFFSRYCDLSPFSPLMSVR